MSHRIGADIGGTFTDLVLVDDAGALFRIAKVLTTPQHPDEAVEQGIRGVSHVTPALRVLDRISSFGITIPCSPAMWFLAHAPPLLS